MRNFLILFILSNYLVASEVKNIDDIENINFNVKTSEVTEIFKDIAKDLIEIKKKQFNILKRLDDIQEKVYRNEQKLGLVELIIDEQKSIIRDVVGEINNLKGEESIKTTPQRATQKMEKSNSTKLENFSPSTFKLLKDNEIYDSVDGNVVKNWTKDRKFTAYQRVGDWIKISGYFSNGRWQSSSEVIWIKGDEGSVIKLKR